MYDIEKVVVAKPGLISNHLKFTTFVNFILENIMLRCKQNYNYI